MAERFPLHLTAPARREVAAILKRSFVEFGERAASRYEALITQALADLAADPERPGSMSRPELAQGARTYHLLSSRWNVVGESVKAPRHFLLYRRIGRLIEVHRILHDARDLKRHLPKDFGIPS